MLGIISSHDIQEVVKRVTQEKLSQRLATIEKSNLAYHEHSYVSAEASHKLSNVD